MITKILVAYDGSTQSQKAFDFGLDLAVKYGAPMTVLSVASPPGPPGDVDISAFLNHVGEYFASHFTGMKTRTAAMGVDAFFEIRVGHPAEEIVSMAAEWKMDAIVMGHRGESLLQKWLVGSVAKRVLSYAHCTVVVVRN
jgi:nucleotide-binding universal stress UspA family protein